MSTHTHTPPISKKVGTLWKTRVEQVLVICLSVLTYTVMKTVRRRCQQHISNKPGQGQQKTGKGHGIMQHPCRDWVCLSNAWLHKGLSLHELGDASQNSSPANRCILFYLRFLYSAANSTVNKYIRFTYITHFQKYIQCSRACATWRLLAVSLTGIWQQGLWKTNCKEPDESSRQYRLTPPPLCQVRP